MYIINIIICLLSILLYVYYQYYYMFIINIIICMLTIICVLNRVFDFDIIIYV